MSCSFQKQSTLTPPVEVSVGMRQSWVVLVLIAIDVLDFNCTTIPFSLRLISECMYLRT